MFERIQLLLIVLLFVLIGKIARQQESLSNDHHIGYAAFVEQANPDKQVENSLVDHSLYAPEAMLDSKSEISSYKAPAVIALLSGYRTKDVFQKKESLIPKAIDPHPRPTEYYVFSLEKILI